MVRCIPSTVTPHVWFHLQGASSRASFPVLLQWQIQIFLLQKNQVGNIRSWHTFSKYIYAGDLLGCCGLCYCCPLFPPHKPKAELSTIYDVYLVLLAGRGSLISWLTKQCKYSQRIHENNWQLISKGLAGWRYWALCRLKGAENIRKPQSLLWPPDEDPSCSVCWIQMLEVSSPSLCKMSVWKLRFSGGACSSCRHWFPSGEVRALVGSDAGCWSIVSVWSSGYA